MMNETFSEYLSKIGMSTPLQDRINAIIRFYETQFNVHIESIFVSDYLSSDGNRIFENLVLFSDYHIMEAKRFVETDDFDMMDVRRALPFWWTMRKEEYDFEEATSSSRMTIVVSTGTISEQILKASGNNCHYLRDVFKKHITTWLGCN